MKDKDVREKFDTFFQDWKLNRVEKYCIGKCSAGVYCDGCRGAVKQFLLAQRVKDREGLAGMVESKELDIPNIEEREVKVTTRDESDSMWYVGRIKYNKALQDSSRLIREAGKEKCWICKTYKSVSHSKHFDFIH